MVDFLRKASLMSLDKFSPAIVIEGPDLSTKVQPRPPAINTNMNDDFSKPTRARRLDKLEAKSADIKATSVKFALTPDSATFRDESSRQFIMSREEEKAEWNSVSRIR